MADFSALKTAIQTYIKQNGNEEITGDILQEILLSVVTTLGDSAINDLVTALANEVAARQNADGTLHQNITNEATARGNADTALGGRIDDEATARANGDMALSNRLGSTITAENTAAEQIGAEAEAREAADTALQGLIDGITDNIENGYVYAGIATPSSTPATGKVFYLALTAGTYTNFGSTVVTQGINILKYNGTAWSLDAFIGIDDEPTAGSDNLIKSGGIPFGKIIFEQGNIRIPDGVYINADNRVRSTDFFKSDEIKMLFTSEDIGILVMPFTKNGNSYTFDNVKYQEINPDSYVYGGRTINIQNYYLKFVARKLDNSNIAPSDISVVLYPDEIIEENQAKLGSKKLATSSLVEKTVYNLSLKVKALTLHQGNIWSNDGKTILSAQNRVYVEDYFDANKFDTIFCEKKVGTVILPYTYSNGEYTYSLTKFMEVNAGYVYGSRSISHLGLSGYYIRIVACLYDGSNFTPDSIDINLGYSYNDYFKQLTFDQGNIFAMDGTEINADNRIRTHEYYKSEDITTVFADKNVGIVFMPFIKNADNTYTYATLSKYNEINPNGYEYGGRTLSLSGYYVRIIARKEDNSNFTPNDVVIHASSLDFYSKATDKKYAVPYYLKSGIESIVSNILGKSEGGPTVVFPYVTDTHFPWSDRGRQRVIENISVIKEISEQISVDAVGMLGDIPSMWGREGVSDTIIYERLRWYSNQYTQVFDKWLNINGNHDADSTDFFNNENWYALGNAKHNRSYVCREGNSPYYYVDFPDMKLRMVFMSIPCSTEATRLTQGITIVYPEERTVHTYWGAGEEQLKWLANTALKTGDGWEVIVFSHTPINYQYTSVNDLMGRVEDKVDIEGIFGAYHNHTTYENGNIVADFSDYHTTKVLLAISGHTHYDSITPVGTDGGFQYRITNNMPCTIVTTAAELISGDREDYTITQECFDIMVYNKSASKIYFCRFGWGSDREVSV